MLIYIIFLFCFVFILLNLQYSSYIVFKGSGEARNTPFSIALNDDQRSSKTYICITATNETEYTLPLAIQATTADRMHASLWLMSMAVVVQRNDMIQQPTTNNN